MLQVGGGCAKAEAIEDWIQGLSPSVVVMQELWDLELEDHSWPHKYWVREGVKGQGLGLAVLLARHLVAPGGRMWRIYDDESALVVAFDSVSGSIWAVGSVHLRPGDSFTEKQAVLKGVVLSLKVVGADTAFPGGDFNCSYHKEHSPLRRFAEGNLEWSRLGMSYVGEMTDVTNEVPQRGGISRTSIDHPFVSGVLGEASERHLLPGICSHKAQLVVSRVRGFFRGPFGWKRYSWRRVGDQDKRQLMDSMEVFWFLGGGSWGRAGCVPRSLPPCCRSVSSPRSKNSAGAVLEAAAGR